MSDHIIDVSGRSWPAPQAPDRTALLVVDVQRDFADPRMLTWLDKADQSRVAAAVDRTAALVERARSAGVPVVWVALEQRLSEPWESSRWLRGLLDSPPEALPDREPCVAASPGADWFRVAPEPGEAVIVKRRYSGFLGTRLEQTLADWGITWVVVCGLTTDCCVDSTARDAFQLGFRAVVPSDATAAYEEHRSRGALAALAKHAALVATVDAVAATWPGDPPMNGV